VLDPFCGSGTTGVAAIQQNREFTGIDLSEHYIKIATDRVTAVEASTRASNPLMDRLY
jgi:site-specific DNA-methyltransferase (adenine-specific)